MVGIYTAMFGGYDRLHVQVDQDVEATWTVFTDNPELEAPAPWRVVLAPGRYSHPRMSAKWFKCTPDAVIPLSESIWIDANTEVTSPSFAREALECINDGIALFAHPQRDCIYDEAEASLRLAPAKYGQLPIAGQVEHYRQLGHPEHAGLFACGTIARRIDDRVRRLGERWLDECVMWTYQDQLSFPVVCAELGVTPGVFPHPQISRHHLGNPWLTIHPHNSNE